MLTIRGAQMSAFRQHSNDQFADELLTHLSNKYPGRCAKMGGESIVKEFIQRGLGRASQVGLNDTGPITALIELFVQFGEGFERSPLREWTIAILDNPVMAGNLKADTLWDRHASLTQGREVVQP